MNYHPYYFNNPYQYPRPSLPPPPLEYYASTPSPYQVAAQAEYAYRLASGIPTNYPHSYPSLDPVSLQRYWENSSLRQSLPPPPPPSSSSSYHQQQDCCYPPRPQQQLSPLYIPQPIPPPLVPTPAATPSPSHYQPSASLSPSYYQPLSPQYPSPTIYNEETLERLIMSTSADIQPELQSVLLDLSSMTVDNLKKTLKKMNETVHTGMRVSGNKAELLARIKSEILALTHRQDLTAFKASRQIVTDVRDGLIASPSPSTSSYNPNPYNPNLAPPSFSVPSSSNAYAPAFNFSAPSRLPINTHLPPPRFGAPGEESLPIRFRPTPFFVPEKTLGNITVLAKAAQGDRKSQILGFALTMDQVELLRNAKASPSNPQYQVRLYSTNEDYYQPSRPTSHQSPAPTDFPPTCEIKLNNHPVAGNTKGIKKMVGSAPPVNLSAGTGLNLGEAAYNRVEVVYVNTEMKYYMTIYLVRISSVKAVLEATKKGKFKPKEDVIADIIKLNSDPDVEATAYGLSLKDPLSFARIRTPIRSSLCSHISCFDAETWFMMMEQTPSWLCPICNRSVKVEDINVDGYFESILKECPSSIGAVTVEPDGTWRSNDNKFGTNDKVVPDVPDPKGKGRAPLTLDSDDGGSNSGDDTDDDKPLRKQRPASNFISLADDDDDDGSSPSRSVSKKTTEVIDLTFSDDDDDDPPPPVARPTFRPHHSSSSIGSGKHGYVPPGQPGGSKRKSSDDDGGLGGGAKRPRND